MYFETTWLHTVLKHTFSCGQLGVFLSSRDAVVKYQYAMVLLPYTISKQAISMFQFVFQVLTQMVYLQQYGQGEKLKLSHD